MSPHSWQNLHIVHHLHPHVVFNRYGQVFDAERPMLERQGVEILQFGPSTRASSRAPS